MSIAYISLGSNLGDREKNCENALKKIAKICRIIDISGFYETPAMTKGDTQRDYINAAIKVETTFAPKELIKALQKIEGELGRPVLREKWAPRRIDLDILLYDDQIIDEPDMKVPHPLMHERMFVLKPLCDIAPDALHPVYGLKVKELLEKLGRKK